LGGCAHVATGIDGEGLGEVYMGTLFCCWLLVAGCWFGLFVLRCSFVELLAFSS
jgi:hypothetical protein